MTNAAQTNFNPPATGFECPFLKLKNDPDVRYGYPHPANYCYRVDPFDPVSLDYQELTCLREAYSLCPVYQNTHWKGRLPQQIRGMERIRVKRPWTRSPFVVLAILILVLVICLLYFTRGQVQDISQALGRVPRALSGLEFLAGTPTLEPVRILLQGGKDTAEPHRMRAEWRGDRTTVTGLAYKSDMAASKLRDLNGARPEEWVEPVYRIAANRGEG